MARGRIGALLLVGLSGAAALVVAAPASAAPAVPATSAYAPVAPTRLVDTRIGLGGTRPGVGGSLVVPVAGRANVPPDATAVVVNVTATETGGPGFVVAYPNGVPRPLASNLNPERPGQTIASLATVPVGAGGAIVLATSAPTDLVVDVLGAYRPAASATTGRFVALGPSRVLDTREGAGPFGRVEQRRIAFPGVPADATAVVVNLTITGESAQPGFWTAWAAGAARPGTSNVNVSAVGQTVPNQAIVPLGPGGVDVFSQSGGHLIVDVFGYFTGPSAPDAADGLFVPTTPTRLLDTREPSNPLGPAVKLLPGWGVEVATNAATGGPVAAVVGTTTAVHGTRAGFVTAWPAGQPRPLASNLNLVKSQVVANLTVVPAGDRGIALLTSGGAHLLFDLVGWYTGTPQASGAALVNPPDGSGMPPLPLTIDHGQALGVGDTGPAVAAVQTRLEALGFWLDGADGEFGYNTSQAVMAFQKWSGLPRTTEVDVDTWEALRTATRPTARSTSGDLVEVDKTKQLLFVIRNGQVRYTINVSTGSEIPYVEVDRVNGGITSGDSITREGRFRVYREYSDGWEYGQLGELYRPKYFDGGIAVHGSNDVPAYPASHGCVRVSNPFMDFVWATNLLPLRSAVWVYR
ncbi:MAG: L,D-transpeptidase family protein [Acidimicrobiales bacterium]